MNKRPRMTLKSLPAFFALTGPSVAVLWSRSSPPSNREWLYYGGDAAGSKYSTLDQINRQNVNQLKVAWTFHTGDLPDERMGATFECTPLMVDGVMYLTTAFSKVIALEAESARVLWTFDPKIDTRKRSFAFANRGVAFWKK